MKILHIEGDKLIRNLFEKIFPSDYTIDFAATGKAALDLLETNFYDYNLVITEIQMQYCNGYEIIQAISKNSLVKIPIIITSHINYFHIAHGLNIAQNNYFKKPFSVGQVLNRAISILKHDSPYAIEIATDKILFNNNISRSDYSLTRVNSITQKKPSIPDFSDINQSVISHVASKRIPVGQIGQTNSLIGIKEDPPTIFTEPDTTNFAALNKTEILSETGFIIDSFKNDHVAFADILFSIEIENGLNVANSHKNHHQHNGQPAFPPAENIFLDLLVLPELPEQPAFPPVENIADDGIEATDDEPSDSALQEGSSQIPFQLSQAPESIEKVLITNALPGSNHTTNQWW